MSVALSGVVVGLHGRERGGHGRDGPEGAFGGLGVRGGSAGSPAEEWAETVLDLLGQVLSVEAVEAAVVHEGADEVGSAERDKCGGGAAFAEPAEEWSVERECFDQRADERGRLGELTVPDVVKDEPALFEGADRRPVAVAVGGELVEPVDAVLPACQTVVVGSDMLEEQELSAPLEDASDLADGPGLVVDSAENERRYDGVECAVPERRSSAGARKTVAGIGARAAARSSRRSIAMSGPSPVRSRCGSLTGARFAGRC